MPFENLPYVNFHELNADWILNKIRDQDERINNFINLSTVKYADPIQWNIATQYEANTIVIDPETGTAYISTQPVPSGVNLDNDEYWNTVFDLSQLVTEEKLYTTPEEHGAVGDGIADDTQAIQEAVNSGKMVLGLSQSAVYRTTNTIRIDGDNKNIYIVGEIEYTGSGAAVQIEGINHRVYVNKISALNGTGVDFYQVNPSINTAYCELKTDNITGKYGITFTPTSHGIQNCYVYLGHIVADIDAIKIGGGISQDPNLPSYTGEIVFYNGRIRGTAGYAIHLDCGSGFEINHIELNNVSFEGSLNGINMDAGTGRIVGCSYINCRVGEITGKIISITGNVRDGYFKSVAPFRADKIEAASTALITRGFTVDNELMSGNGIKTIKKAYICEHGILLTPMQYRKSIESDYTYDSSANDYCCSFFYTGAAGTFTVVLPYLSAHSMEEFIVFQTGDSRKLIIKDCEDKTAFDGTNRATGTYLVKCYKTSTSSIYTVYTLS